MSTYTKRLYPWFAWYPVRIFNNGWVWWVHVWCQETNFSSWGEGETWYDYFLSKPE